MSLNLLLSKFAILCSFYYLLFYHFIFHMETETEWIHPFIQPDAFPSEHKGPLFEKDEIGAPSCSYIFRYLFSLYYFIKLFSKSKTQSCFQALFQFPILSLKMLLVASSPKLVNNSVSWSNDHELIFSPLSQLLLCFLTSVSLLFFSCLAPTLHILV